MRDSSPVQSTNSISRRSFLHVTSGVLAATVLSESAFAESNSTAQSTNSVRSKNCAIGYVDAGPAGSGDDMRNPVIDARKLWRGEKMFATQGITLDFQGIRFPHELMAAQLSSVQVDLPFQVNGVDSNSIPWHMWSFSNRDVRNVSGGVTTNVPIGDNGALTFNIALEWTEGEVEHYQAVLSTGFRPGAAKLQSGTYCIALPSVSGVTKSPWSRAQWDELTQSCSLDTPYLVCNVSHHTNESIFA
jgi:hypothetical protein